MNSVCSGDSLAFTVLSDQEAESDTEAVIQQALRSGRLLYEPHLEDEDDAASCCRLIKQHSSINKKKQAAVANNDDGSSSKAPPPAALVAAFGGATAMSVESHNPYRDFRESMEEMVVSQVRQQKDWRWLEDMLAWYLKANAKSTHGIIVAAFVDLLLALTSSPAADAADYNYSSSFSSSPVTTPPSSASATNCSAPSSIDDCSCCSSSSF